VAVCLPLVCGIRVTPVTLIIHPRPYHTMLHYAWLHSMIALLAQNNRSKKTEREKDPETGEALGLDRRGSLSLVSRMWA
jgi:hypothetical protein